MEIWPYRDTEMHSIISVDFLWDPTNDWVLDKFVALPLQTNSFLCFCPTVWIHPTTEINTKTINEWEQTSSERYHHTVQFETMTCFKRIIDQKCCCDDGKN